MSDRVPILLLILLASLGIYVFFALFESYEDISDSGWSQKARRYPLLAAKQFLEKTGEEKVTTTHRLEKLEELEKFDVIFISNAQNIVSQKQTARLIDWVEQGGHLIVGMGWISDDSYPLLDYFSVSLEDSDYSSCGCSDGSDEEDEGSEETESSDSGDSTEKEEDEEKPYSEIMREFNQSLEQQRLEESSEQEEEGEESEGNADEVDERALTRLEFDQDEITVLYFNPYETIYHPAFDYDSDDEDAVEEQGDYLYEPTYWNGSEAGVHFLQFKPGEGLVTFLSDGQIWENSYIDEFDHAYLLWMLMPEDGNILMLYGTQMPSLWALLWKHFPEMVIAFMVLLFSWLIYRSKRFGPIEKLNITQRRSLAEHLLMNGRYYWEGQHHEKLLAPLRKEVLALAAHLHPGFHNMKPAEKIAYLCEKSRLSASRINDALYKDLTHNEDRLIKTVTDLQVIRKSL